MAAEDSLDQTIWERLDQGRKLKAARGGYAGYGSPPFGLTSVNGELVEDPQEQEVIDIIRRHHKSGKSLQQISDWLNQRGYKTKRNQQWRRVSIKRVLDRLYSKTPKFSGVDPTKDDEHQDNVSQPYEINIDEDNDDMV